MSPLGNSCYNERMARALKEKSVIVALWSAGSCGRKQLAGILKYANRGRPWNIRNFMDPRDLTPEILRKAETDGTNGLIAFACSESAPALAASTLPTVLMSFPVPALAKRKTNLIRFVNDNPDIGARGADYLLSLGSFSSYVFAADTLERGWSRLRERGFRARLARSGHVCQTIRGDKNALAAALRTLPRPIALMAPYDFRAKEVLDACRQAKLSVPRDVAILGVDNDDLICESSRPSLSSINLDQEAIGYRAAETLDRMMAARNPATVRTVILPTGFIAERESTKAVPPAARLVERLTAYLDAHALEGISVADAVRELGVSRRLADLRFRELTGKTIRQAIEERRLLAIRHRLAETDLPIGKITRLCGYAGELRAKYAFKARFGLTMSAWRKKSKIPSP